MFRRENSYHPIYAFPPAPPIFNVISIIHVVYLERLLLSYSEISKIHTFIVLVKKGYKNIKALPKPPLLIFIFRDVKTGPNSVRPGEID
jgi:hypothetical protein